MVSRCSKQTFLYLVKVCAHYENRGIGCSGLNVEQPGKQVVEFPLTIREAIDQLEGGREEEEGREEGREE